MSKRKQYTKESQKDAVRLMLARGSRTIPEVAKELGVTQSMLYRWHKRYAAELGGSAAGQSSAEDVEAMRRRLRELEMENTLLKKAAALFAKEVK